MKKIGILLLCVVMLCSCVAPIAFAGDIDTSKKIKKLEIEKEPDKVYYEVGDEFTVEGGIVKMASGLSLTKGIVVDVKDGAAFLALYARVPVIPMHIEPPYRLFRKTSVFPRKTPSPARSPRRSPGFARTLQDRSRSH